LINVAFPRLIIFDKQLRPNQNQSSNVGLGPDARNECRNDVDVSPSPFQINRVFGIGRVWQTEEQLERRLGSRSDVTPRSRSRSRHFYDVDRRSTSLPALDAQRDGRVLLLAEGASVLGRRKRFVDVLPVDRVDRWSERWKICLCRGR
jgi:hypothetical protein